MSLAEDTNKDTECSVMKVDAGRTPKLSRRKSVSNDCNRSVIEILAKRTPGSSVKSSSCNSSSWLHTVKKSSLAIMHAVENRQKDCSCVQLELDAAPVSKMAKCTRCHSSANNTSTMVCGSNSGTSSQHCASKSSSSSYSQVISIVCELL